MVESEHIRQILYDMKLSAASDCWTHILKKPCMDSKHMFSFYIIYCLLNSRSAIVKVETRMKLSKLLHQKQLEAFDFEFQPSIDKRQVDEVDCSQLDCQEAELFFG